MMRICDSLKFIHEKKRNNEEKIFKFEMERLTRASSQVSNFKHLMYAKCARFDKSKQFESRHDPHMKLKKIRKIFKIKWRKKNSIHSSTNKTLSWSGNSNSDIRCRSNRWLRDGGWSGSRGGWKNSFLSLFANRCERRIVFIYFFFCYKTLRFFPSLEFLSLLFDCTRSWWQT